MNESFPRPALSPASSPVRHPVRLERDRLTILHGLDILDTPPEREFDAIVAAAQALLGCKIALVSLVDRDRQWFKARCGLAATETPRELAFCAHAVAADDTLVVLDAMRDRRFCGNPLVTGAPFIRFYAGVPIRARGPGGGEPLPMGTLCVIDDRPRIPDPAQLALLVDVRR